MSTPAILKQLAESLKAPRIDAEQQGPDLRWAHRIVDRWRRGEPVKQATLQMARDALGIKGDGHGGR